MPGVTFEKQVQFTPQGPVLVDVITAPKPGGPYELMPALAHGTVSGALQPVASIQQDALEATAVAGINGDTFNTRGAPAGIVLAKGVLAHGAYSRRSSIGVDAGGMLHVKRISFVGTWKGAGQRRPLTGINQVPHSGPGVLLPTA